MSRNTIRRFLQLLDGDLVEWLPIFAGVLIAVVLIWSIVRIKTWFQGDDDPDAADEQLLAGLVDLQREGDLTHEEYRSIKSRIIDRMEGTKDAPDAGSSIQTELSEQKNAVDVSNDGIQPTHST